jgi:hypothetical protein
MATAASTRVTRGQASTEAMPLAFHGRVMDCFAAEDTNPELMRWCKQKEANAQAVDAGRAAVASAAIYCAHYPQCKNSYHPGARLVFVVPAAAVAG